jgi:hypothetical protein
MIRVSFFFLFSTLFLSFTNTSLGITLTQSKRLKVYVSSWSQNFTKTQSGDYIAPNTITVDNNSFTFLCPGGSFLVGLASKFENKGRRFQFACAFFENAQGKLITKTSSKCTTTGWDNTLLNSGTSSCTNQFLGGMNGLFHINTAGGGTSSQVDTQYKGVCCTPESPEQAAIVPDSCGQSTTLNAAGANVGMMMCGSNMVMQEVSSRFDIAGGNGDRIVSFKCCQLKQN